MTEAPRKIEHVSSNNPSDEEEEGSFHDPDPLSANTEEKLSVIEEHLGLPKQKDEVSFEEVEEKSYEP